MKFQVVNIGLIISLSINFFVSHFLLNFFIRDSLFAVGITLFVFLCAIGILYTPVGDWWYRKVVLRLREANDQERKRIEQIYREVYRRALVEVPNLPGNIKLYIYDDDSLNAFAIGLRTIAVHRGLLYNDLYDNEIAAILSHEIAHIANGDTFCTILAVQSNTIVSILRIIISYIMLIAGKFMGLCTMLLFGIWGSENGEELDDSFNIGDDLVKALSFLLDKGTACFFYISVIIAQYSRRKHELEADSFSAKLGYGQDMIHFFKRFSDGENTNNKFSLAYLLNGTHPCMSVRIANIQNNNKIK